MFETVHEGNLSRILKIDDGLYFREGNLEVRDQCNVGIVELPDSLVLIDYPEQSPDEEILEEAEALLGKRVRQVFITHAHCDHVTGFKTLHRKDLSIIASRACIAQMRLEGYPVPEVYQEITGSTQLTLGGVIFDLVLPGHIAHSPWDMLVGLPGYGIVFTGDLVVLQKNMFFHSSEISGWRTTIEELKQRNWKLLGRGHGPVIGPEYLDDVALYLRLLDEAKHWQTQHNEPVDEVVVSGGTGLSPTLRVIADQLLQYADAANVARQINQLSERTREGY